MSASIPNAPVVHLYHQAKRDLEEGTVSDFQDSLIEFNRTFSILLEQHSQSDSGVPRFKDRVQNILERHTELYQLALSRDMALNFRYPLINILASNLRTAIQEEESLAAGEVVKTYIECFRLEMESESGEDLPQHFAKRLQNPTLEVTRAFRDAESIQDIDRFQKKADHIHQVYRNAGKTAIESNNQQALELILESRREHLDIADIYVPTYPHEDSDIPIEIREKKAKISETYENQEIVFLFVLMSWANRYYDAEFKSRGEILDFLLDEIISKVECFADVAELVREETQFENKYWERWQMQEILSDSMGVSSGSMAAHTWIRKGYQIVIGNVMRTGEGALIPDVDLSESEIPNDEWYLDYKTKIGNLLNNLREPSEQPTYLVQQFGRSIPKVRAEALLNLHERLVTELEERQHERWLRTDLDPEEVEGYIRRHQQDYIDGITLRKRLRDRGNWVVKHPSPSDLEGVKLVQYPVPRERFISDAPSPPKSRGPPAWMSAGLYRFLGRRLFEERRVSRYSELEKEIKKKVRRESDAEVFTAKSAEYQFFGEDDEYKPFARGDPTEDQVGSIRSRPVFEDFMYPYDAVVVSKGDTKIVEFGNPPMILNMSVTPGEEANLGPRFEGDPAAVDRSQAIITLRVRIGIRSGSVLGTAYLVGD